MPTDDKTCPDCGREAWVAGKMQDLGSCCYDAAIRERDEAESACAAAWNADDYAKDRAAGALLQTIAARKEAREKCERVVELVEARHA